MDEKTMEQFKKAHARIALIAEGFGNRQKIYVRQHVHRQRLALAEAFGPIENDVIALGEETGANIAELREKLACDALPPRSSGTIKP
jgi:hypothetical protein